MTYKILIIITTYNGEHYLSEQIASILKQSCEEWELIIRNDGSIDTTFELIRRYAHRYPDKIRVLSDQLGHIGISESFLQLLNASQADYVMFGDQDDVWLPNKIEVTLKKMKELEGRYGVDMPVLIHTDLKVADEGVNVVAESFWEYQYLNPKTSKSLNRLLTQNAVTGCTMMINKALKDKIKLIPEQAIAYDWWISLVAALFGKIDYVTSPTILYRQHDSNSIGAKEWGLKYINKMARLGRINLRAILLKTQMQAEALLEMYRQELSQEQVKLLIVYSTLNQQDIFMRRFNLLRFGFLKTGFRRNVGLFFAV